MNKRDGEFVNKVSSPEMFALVFLLRGVRTPNPGKKLLGLLLKPSRPSWKQPMLKQRLQRLRKKPQKLRRQLKKLKNQQKQLSLGRTTYCPMFPKLLVWPTSKLQRQNMIVPKLGKPWQQQRPSKWPLSLIAKFAGTTKRSTIEAIGVMGNADVIITTTTTIMANMSAIVIMRPKVISSTLNQRL